MANENEYKLSYTAEQINERLGKAGNAVLHTEQKLTDEQQAQARANIGAITKDDIPVYTLTATKTGGIVSVTPVENTTMSVRSTFDDFAYKDTRYMLTLNHINGSNLVDFKSHLDFGSKQNTDMFSVTINNDHTVKIVGTNTSSNYTNPIEWWYEDWFDGKKNAGDFDSYRLYGSLKMCLPAGTYTTHKNFTVQCRGKAAAVGEDGCYPDTNLGNRRGTFTIDEPFWIRGWYITVAPGKSIDDTIPLAIVAGSTLPAGNFEYTGVKYTANFANEIRTECTFDWETGELRDADGTLIEQVAGIGKIPTLSGANRLFTTAAVESTVKYKKLFDGEDLDDIAGSGTSSGSSESFDPTAYGLPILYLSGSTAGMSKDNAVTMNYDYNGRIGTCTVKWQGSSSLSYDKKNYTIKFDNAFEAADGWGVQSKYCLKANYIDHSHARNVVNAKLWGQVLDNRKWSVHNQLRSAPNYGAVDGFPIIIVLNDEFHGLYTFNIPKDGWMMGMGSGTNEAIVCADQWGDATYFKAPANLSGDFELEYVSDAANADWVTTSLNRLINACINSDGTDLDTTIAQYVDLQSAIDYYIFTVLIMGYDMTGKNYLLSTFDGTKWYFGAYDMDSTHGIAWDGKEYHPADYIPTFESFAASHRLFELIKTHKADIVKDRYAALRNTVLSESNIAVTFGNFAGKIPSPVYMQEAKKWPMIPNTSTNNISQIRDYYRMRVALADKWIEEL